MRRMTQIPVVEKSKLMTTSFKGYNHQEIISDGEMFDTKNLSGDMFPVLTTRKKRGVTENDRDWNGIFSLNGLVTIKGKYVYYKDSSTGLKVDTSAGMMPKHFVSMGAYVCIWPDKVYFNTLNYTDGGSMERRWNSGDAPDDAAAPQAQICRSDGTNYDMTTVTVSSTAPQNPTDGKLWIDQSGDTDVLRQYSTTTTAWVEVPTVYTKISGYKAGEGLHDYDTVVIRNLKAAEGTTPSARVQKQLEELNGSHIVYGAGEGYLIVVGLLSAVTTLDDEDLEINREVPDLDYVCESNNRLWGCKYGIPRELMREWNDTGDHVYIELCDENGTVYQEGEVTKSSDWPQNAEIGDLYLKEDEPPYTNDSMWICTGTGGTYGSWEKITSYVKFSGTDIGKGLKAGDIVVINGVVRGSSGMINMQEVQEYRLLNGDRTIIVADDDYIVVEGIVRKSHSGGWLDSIWTGQGYDVIPTTVRVNKKTYAKDFMNEIRACKLGDFKNWDTYMGLSSDSYAVSIGTEGAFTGAITQRGVPVFFKENSIHKIYGNNPSSFQVQTSMYKGIQDGSWRSAVTIDEIIYYKSTDDVMMYDGNNATSIGTQLGKDEYSDARAGTLNKKYYISMKKGDAWHLFTYDTQRGIWYREDNTKALEFAETAEDLFYIDETENNLVTVKGSQGTAESDFDWYAVFGIDGVEYRANAYGSLSRTDHWGQQYLSRFDIRMYIEEGTQVELYLKYDSDGDWIHSGSIRGNKMKTFVLPVIPRRCDHMQMKLTGSGEFRIYSICKTMEAGNDG